MAADFVAKGQRLRPTPQAGPTTEPGEGPRASLGQGSALALLRPQPRPSEESWELCRGLSQATHAGASGCQVDGTVSGVGAPRSRVGASERALLRPSAAPCLGSYKGVAEDPVRAPAVPAGWPSRGTGTATARPCVGSYRIPVAGAAEAPDRLCGLPFKRPWRALSGSLQQALRKALAGL